MAASLTMKELLESGVHFGHPTRRWNPKMKRYIYGARNGIYIIDLHQTIKLFEDALKYVETLAEGTGHMLFVGTKKQAQTAVKEAAIRSKQYFVVERWMGGMLTNWKTMQNRITRLRELEKMIAEGYLDRLPKKEAAERMEEHDSLERYFEGIKDMPGLPAALFIVDLKKEEIAVAEARKLNIPIVAIVDTNCDPDDADYIIPGNDDAIRAIRLVSGKIAETIAEVRHLDEIADAEAAAAALAAAPEVTGEEAEPIVSDLEIDEFLPAVDAPAEEFKIEEKPEAPTLKVSFEDMTPDLPPMIGENKRAATKKPRKPIIEDDADTDTDTDEEVDLEKEVEPI